MLNILLTWNNLLLLCAMRKKLLSSVQEGYLKLMYELSGGRREEGQEEVDTSTLSNRLSVSPSAVGSVLQRLHRDKYVFYEKYKGGRLLPKGERVALQVIRRHRLWQVFLHKKLQFAWSELQSMAEELAHASLSEALLRRMEEFLDFPTTDPCGRPIPNGEGILPDVDKVLLSDMISGEKGKVVEFKESSPEFLQYLEKHDFSIGNDVEVIDKELFDGSITLQMQQRTLSVSNIVASNLWVIKEEVSKKADLFLEDSVL